MSCRKATFPSVKLQALTHAVIVYGPGLLAAFVSKRDAEAFVSDRASRLAAICGQSETSASAIYRIVQIDRGTLKGKSDV